MAATRSGSQLGRGLLSARNLCFRYGERDHRARDCRNPITCFRYRGVGHRSFNCLRRNDGGPDQNKPDIAKQGRQGKGAPGQAEERAKTDKEGRREQGPGMMKAGSIPAMVKVTIPELTEGAVEILRSVVIAEVLKETGDSVVPEDIKACLTRVWGHGQGRLSVRTSKGTGKRSEKQPDVQPLGNNIVGVMRCEGMAESEPLEKETGKRCGSTSLYDMDERVNVGSENIILVEPTKPNIEDKRPAMDIRDSNEAEDGRGKGSWHESLPTT
ncbi:hypothetical protein J5N97_003364 [Dioscorea zingiberensis]|uniref:Uncharacterized protein n=1 Tax=Dioscorea zingiberensis TaxID=325984 RepID=A0A9D5HQD6_9LILI|nr:hypothetical protein J5N97_003364 [Dioscorea zingiberensis]